MQIHFELIHSAALDSDASTMIWYIDTHYSAIQHIYLIFSAITIIQNVKCMQIEMMDWPSLQKSESSICTAWLAQGLFWLLETEKIKSANVDEASTFILSPYILYGINLSIESNLGTHNTVPQCGFSLFLSAERTRITISRMLLFLLLKFKLYNCTYNNFVSSWT